MNKKPGLFFTISILAMIIIAVSFSLDFGGYEPVKLNPGVNPNNILYVCPMASVAWDQIAQAMSFGSRYIYMLFCFAFLVLIFSWSWALYQNLVKDKFSVDVYKNPWALTKIFFWAAIICIILAMTPNYFRKVNVSVNGHNVERVLCERNSHNAKAINVGQVTLR